MYSCDMPSTEDVLSGVDGAALPATSPGAVPAPRPLTWLGAVCGLLLVVCELIARPFAELALCDDWSYLRSAEILARTGHVGYNGWAAPIGGWQLYAGAAMIRLFGDSYTSVRWVTLAVAALMTFLIQRTMARCGLSERNAALGTLALVLSPLFMQLSVSYMSDIGGLLALVVCIYACLRALQAPSDGAVAAWIVVAPIANALLGTARQIGWLGVLVIVPSTLWLLRRRSRSVVIAGALATMTGGAIVYGCIHWFDAQPYAIPEHVTFHVEGLRQLLYMARQFSRVVLEIPFFLLALLLPFLAEYRRNPRRLLPLAALLTIAYLFYALQLTNHGSDTVLDPLMGDWVSDYGFFYGSPLADLKVPIVFAPWLRIALTALKMLALLGLLNFLWRVQREKSRATAKGSVFKAYPAAPRQLSWSQLSILLAPFTVCYLGLLVPRSTVKLLDRYLLGLLVVAAIFLVRLFQDYGMRDSVRRRLPGSVVAGVAVVALFSIADVHDLFAFYRARVAILNEVVASGVAPNHIDGGWEYNAAVELKLAGHLNSNLIVSPPHSYVPLSSHRGWTCDGKLPYTDENYAHFLPQYGVAGAPDSCAGATSFQPVRFVRWLDLTETPLYIVRYQPPVPGQD